MVEALNHNAALKIYENIQMFDVDDEPFQCDGPYVTDVKDLNLR